MSDKTEHVPHIPHDRGTSDQRPYWRRAHHDWRFWLAMLLMGAAISTYVLTEDLRFRPHDARVTPSEPVAPPSNAPVR